MPIPSPLRPLLAAALLAAGSACSDAVGVPNPYAGRAVTRPVTAAGGRQFAQVSAGFMHTCALTPEGAAYCWGRDEEAQVGADAGQEQCETLRCLRRPAAVVGGHEFAQVSAGTTRTCAIDRGGAAWCWGGDFSAGEPGYLGDGEAMRSSRPLRVAADSPFVAVAAGRSTCALTASGVAYCWGPNLDGEVGDSTTTARARPVRVAQGSVRFRTISSRGAHVCAISFDDALYCWGSNRWGQLGIGEVPYNAFGLRRRFPGRVWPDSAFRLVAAGGEHTCAVTVAGGTYCWGRNDNAQQLGAGPGTTHRGLPGAVVGGPGAFTRLDAGDIGTCGVTAAGASWCWGSNYFGAIGDGRTAAGGVPPTRTLGGPYRSVSMGGSHACGVRIDGTVACWGDQFYGQLGNR